MKYLLLLLVFVGFSSSSFSQDRKEVTGYVKNRAGDTIDAYQVTNKNTGVIVTPDNDKKFKILAKMGD